MMLGEPDHVDAQLVREPCFAQCLVDHDAIPRWVAAVRKEKIAEFHAGPSTLDIGRITDGFRPDVKASKK